MQKQSNVSHHDSGLPELPDVFITFARLESELILYPGLRAFSFSSILLVSKLFPLRMKYQMQSFNAKSRNPLIIIEFLSEHTFRKQGFRAQIGDPASVNLMFRPQSLHRLSSK